MNGEELKGVIEEYLRDSKAEYAVMIDGDWGSGKTYFLTHSLTDIIEKVDEGNDEQRRYAYVSLYGVKSTSEVSKEIMFQYLGSKKSNKFKVASNILTASLGLSLIHISWKHVCEVLGLETMPVFVKEMDNDEASVVMVDSNIQRENIRPSEKAKAYKIKYDAMKNQGKAGNSLKMMSEESGENYKMIQRYICLLYTSWNRITSSALPLKENFYTTTNGLLPQNYATAEKARSRPVFSTGEKSMKLIYHMLECRSLHPERTFIWSSFMALRNIR